MKTISTRQGRQNPGGLSAISKTKASPSTKENTSISSKYLSLLKRKPENAKDSPKTDSRPNKTMKGQEAKDFKDFSKILHESKKENTTSSKVKERHPKKDLLVFNTGQSCANDSQQFFCRNETEPHANFEHNAIYKTFRSPPVNSKLTPQSYLMNSFNSVGKSRTRSPINKPISQNFKKQEENKLAPGNDRRFGNLNAESQLQKNNPSPSVCYISLGDGVKVRNRCSNHPQKKSKYYVKDEKISTDEDGTKILPAFCSNCTFSLVKNGYACEEIKASEEETKKEKLNAFIDKLAREKENCEAVARILNSKHQTLKQVMDQETSKVDDYFDALVEDLNAQRKAIKKRLGYTYDSSAGILGDFIDAFGDFQTEFSTINQDIELTYDKIIKSSEIGPFNEILDSYKERLSEFREVNEHLEQVSLKTEGVNFRLPYESMSSRFRVNYDIKTDQAKIIDSKEIDLSINDGQTQPQVVNIVVPDSISDFPIEESPECPPSNLEDSFRKSDVNVSIDRGYTTEGQLVKPESFNDITVSNVRESVKSQQKLSSALDRISNSQSITNNQYLKLLGLMKKETKPQIDDDTENCEEPEGEEADQNIFELENKDLEELLNKQTPDLGCKLDHPEYLQDYYQSMCTNVGNTDISLNIQENITKKEGGVGQLKSQKILFQ